MEERLDERKKELLNYLKPILKASVILALIYVLIAVFFGGYLGLVITTLAFALISPFFFILLAILYGIYRFFKYLDKAMTVSRMLWAVGFSIIICFLTFKIYHGITMTSMGAMIFYPKTHKKVTEYFQKSYGREYRVTGVSHYLSIGNEASEGGWYKIATGHFLDEPETRIGVSFNGEYIVEGYGRSIFRKKVIKYYKDMLKKVIPWEHKLSLQVNGFYSSHYMKSYEEVLESKDPEIVQWLDFFIVIPYETFQEVGKDQFQRVFLKTAQRIYEKNSYLKKDSSLNFHVIKAPVEEVDEFSVDYLLKNYEDGPYKLRIGTKYLDKSFLELNTFNELERYMKEKNREVEY